MQLLPSTEHAIKHPGQVLNDRFLKRFGISITEAAAKLYMKREQLSRFINGHTGVSVELALKLEVATGVSAEYWLTRQAQYDIQQSSQSITKVKAEPFCQEVLAR
ncbi:HigA family addiction module antidote protein [Pseudidiomarina marina]|uniref:HigA family addiction module antitoxin n=1 Tax=Pseudidiomarina marina TaxID=502366 RepID=UPI0038503D6D